MSREKINFGDFVRQISKDTGYAQKDITAVLNSAAETTLHNLNNGIETAVFRGMIVYPGTYKDTIKFARARFGKSFKLSAPIS